MKIDIKTVDELHDRTADAYSWDRYGEAGWKACIKMLLRDGWDERQIEAILRSKWTRWASDMATDRPGKNRDGSCNGADLRRFMVTLKNLHKQVEELVVETFGN